MLMWDIWLTTAVLLKLIVYISSFMAIGSMLFIIMVQPTLNTLQKNLLNITITMCLIALVTTAISIPVQAGQMLDSGIIGMMDREMLQLVVQGPSGTSTFIRAVGLLILIGAVFFISTRLILIPIGAFMVALSFALVGHATEQAMWLSSFLTLHLLAVSYWIGGLWPLHRLVSSIDTRPMAGLLARRFGKQAQYIVPVLIVTGVIFSVMLVGSFQALFGSLYGWVLIGKISVVCLLLGLAALNKLVLVPSLLKADEQAATRLRLSIRFEAFSFFIILFIISVLTSAITPPK
ncbi:MAG: CopD family protein [Hyphomicrobiales bacterium]